MTTADRDGYAVPGPDRPSSRPVLTTGTDDSRRYGHSEAGAGSAAGSERGQLDPTTTHVDANAGTEDGAEPHETRNRDADPLVNWLVDEPARLLFAGEVSLEPDTVVDERTTARAICLSFDRYALGYAEAIPETARRLERR